MSFSAIFTALKINVSEREERDARDCFIAFSLNLSDFDKTHFVIRFSYRLTTIRNFTLASFFQNKMQKLLEIYHLKVVLAVIKIFSV